MKDYVAKSVLADKLFQPLVNDPCLNWSAVVLGKHKIIVLVRSVTGRNMSFLFFLVFQQHSRNGFGNIDPANAGISFDIRQNEASRTVLLQFREAIIVR